MDCKLAKFFVDCKLAKFFWIAISGNSKPNFNLQKSKRQEDFSKKLLGSNKPGYRPTGKTQYGYNNNPGGQGIKRFGKDDPMMELEMKNQRIMQAIQEMDNDDDMPLDREGKKKAKDEKGHWWRQSKVNVKDDPKKKDKASGEKGFWGFLSKKWGCGARGSNIICANFGKEK